MLAALAVTLTLAAGSLWLGVAPSGDFSALLAQAINSREPSNSSAKPAIAVLPFQNQNTDQERDYFADGMTQDIINALGRFSALTVISWNAVFPYKNKPANPGEIARSLAVRIRWRAAYARLAIACVSPHSSSTRMAACFGQPASTRR